MMPFILIKTFCQIKIRTGFLLLLISTFSHLVISAQDKLISDYARKNVTHFNRKNDIFVGEGWEKIINESKKTNYVLIGEDHLTNEIPFFVSLLAKSVRFDNFFTEIDPFSAVILSSKMQNLPPNQFNKFVSNYGNTFSFFALKPEFQLLKQLVKSKTNIFGLDQIVMNADRLLTGELKKSTKNARAKNIYEKIESQSNTDFSNFLRNPRTPMYMLTPEFEQNLQLLSSLRLSQREIEILEALKISLLIYKERNHSLRVKLMKNQLLKKIDTLKNGKNLFKLGANHLPSGESLMKVYDIGNLVSNIADSKFEKSLHIMIVGKSGTKGAPFKGFPNTILDSEKGGLSFLNPFFQTVMGESWHCFNLLPIRTEVEKGIIQITDARLLRTIKGYDYLIIIPTVTASGF